MISKKNKKLLLELANYTCEHCKKKFDIKDLEIHRIHRGCENGTYHWRNCMVLCSKHHKLFHSGEFNSL